MDLPNGTESDATAVLASLAKLEAKITSVCARKEELNGRIDRARKRLKRTKRDCRSLDADIEENLSRIAHVDALIKDALSTLHGFQGNNELSAINNKLDHQAEDSQNKTSKGILESLAPESTESKTDSRDQKDRLQQGSALSGLTEFTLKIPESSIVDRSSNERSPGTAHMIVPPPLLSPSEARLLSSRAGSRLDVFRGSQPIPLSQRQTWSNNKAKKRSPAKVGFPTNYRSPHRPTYPAYVSSGYFKNKPGHLLTSPSTRGKSANQMGARLSRWDS